MKKLKLYLFSLLLLLSSGFNANAFTATQQTVLFGSSCPTIGGTCPSINANFTTDKYWVEGVGFVPLTSIVSTSRASSALSQDTNGTWYSFSANTLRVTNKGALIEEARTNKCTNYNANPPALVAMGTAAAFNAAVTNITAGAGTGTPLFGVVDDSAAIAASGLANVSNGRTYVIDNTLGTSDSSLTFSGVAGNTNTHTISAYGRVIGTAGANNRIEVQDTTSIRASFTGTTTYTRVSASGVPTAISLLRVRAIAGATVYVTLNQLEEGAFVTSPIVVAGASATRAADVPQLIGPALTAALAAKAAFFQTNGMANSTAPRPIDSSTGRIQFDSTTVVDAVIGANTAPATLGAGTSAGTVKFAMAFDAINFSMVANGGTKVTNANAFSFTGAVYLGTNLAATRIINGYMQRFAFSPVKGVFDGATRP
jgi:hypothetical protein